MAIQKITADVISSDAITTASISDSAITAAKLAGTLDLTGKTITVATASSGDNDTTVASTAFVATAIANLADSAPSTLDTLNELAAALGDDANFSTTVTNSIATKMPLAGGTFTGDIAMGTNQIIFDNNSQAIQIKDAAGTASYVLYQDNADTLILGNNTNVEKIRLDTSGNEGALTVDTNGNVGIGTNNPTKLLHVDGQAQFENNITLNENTPALVVPNGDFRIFTGGSETLRITSARNLKFVAQTTNFESPGFTYHTNNYLYCRGGSSGLILSDDSGINTIQIIDGSNGYINFETSDGSSKMRIDSLGRVGIGTSSPSTTLQVGDGSGDEYITIDKSTTGTSGILFKNAGNNKGKILLNSNEELEFYTNNTTKALQIFESGLSTFTGPASQVNLGGGSTGSAAIYINSTSGHTGEMLQILKNGSTRLHMANDGKLGIGTSSPSAKIHATIEGSVPTISSNTVAVFNRSGGLSHEAYVSIIGGTTGASALHFGDTADEDIGRIEYRHASGDADHMAFYVAGSERMRIDSNGVTGFGTSPQGTNTGTIIAGGDVVATDSFGTAGTHLSLVYTAGTNQEMHIERSNGNRVATFTEGQNLLLGDISSNLITYGALQVARGGYTAGHGGIVGFFDTDTSVGSSNLIQVCSFSGDTDATGGQFIRFRDSNSVMGSISAANGTQVSYGVSSDERLKENIVDASSQLNTVKNIKVREFDWKANSYHEVGMIAQELHSVIPSVVQQGGDSGTEEPWTVDYAKLTPYLIKAVQEQQTIIDDLKSRLDEAGL